MFIHFIHLRSDALITNGETAASTAELQQNLLGNAWIGCSILRSRRKKENIKHVETEENTPVSLWLWKLGLNVTIILRKSGSETTQVFIWISRWGKMPEFLLEICTYMAVQTTPKFCPSHWAILSCILLWVSLACVAHPIVLSHAYPWS